MRRILNNVRNFYGRFERPISSVSLVGGFVFDALVLKQIDLFWENFWIIVHLLAVAIFIVLLNKEESKLGDVNKPSEAHFWYINILQFTFGGLLGTFIVFYFRSTTLTVTWPFIVLLALAFIANESLKQHYTRLTFQISLFYLSILSFAVFIVPVFFHKIGKGIFLTSGFISLVILFIFLYALWFFAKEKFKGHKLGLGISVGGIFLLTNTLYFLNLIPPIPLSLKDAGVFHEIKRESSGNYLVKSELKTNPFSYFYGAEDFHRVGKDNIYVYSAIFSPASFITDIIHEWQKYDELKKAWITVNRIGLKVGGGREGGFRTYSLKDSIASGKWRVNVKTEEGQVIGQIRFNVIDVDAGPELKTVIKN